MQDRTIKNQLNLCYQYDIKEKALNNILLNMYDVIEHISSEIELIQTDIKIKNMKEPQLINRINLNLTKYKTSNYVFHDEDANPNNEVLRAYWEKQITRK